MKKLKKTILGMTKSGLVLGVGTQVVGRVGGETGGLANLSRALPKVGTIAGASTVMGMLPKIKTRKKRKRRRKR